jgi:hypothetical protein
MIVKEVHLGDSGQDKLRGGRTVLIESENHVGGITVTKDGVTVAKSINLYDPTENLAVVMMRQAAEKTATMAGQGDQRDHTAYRFTPQEEEQEGQRTQVEGCRNHICQQ